VSSYREQAPTGSHADIALVQGTSARDINTTAFLHKWITDNRLDPEGKVQIGTLDGRVTLRGSVSDEATRSLIGGMAIAEVKLYNVDNQITVAPPLHGKASSN
jgi:osmotically-inducible protein OsmY